MKQVFRFYHGSELGDIKGQIAAERDEI